MRKKIFIISIVVICLLMLLFTMCGRMVVYTTPDTLKNTFIINKSKFEIITDYLVENINNNKFIDISCNQNKNPKFIFSYTSNKKENCDIDINEVPADVLQSLNCIGDFSYITSNSEYIVFSYRFLEDSYCKIFQIRYVIDISNFPDALPEKYTSLENKFKMITEYYSDNWLYYYESDDKLPFG